MDISHTTKPVVDRTRITPKEHIQHVTFALDPRQNEFIEMPDTPQLSAGIVEALPENACIQTMGSPETVAWFRKKAYQGKFGADLCLDVVGSVDTIFRTTVYKMPAGTYYGPAREAFFPVLDRMEKGLLHYFTFSGNDTLQLFWIMAKQWTEERAQPVRIRATYEGLIHTLQVRRPLDGEMTTRELDAQEKAQARIERAREREARLAAKAARTPPPTALPKPYHNMEVGQEVSIPPEDYTTINSLRVVVYSYGKRNGIRFSVRQQLDDSVLITRLE